MNILHKAGLGFICCLALPGAAIAWTVGERGDAGSIFLYDEPLEGVYANNWWGTAVSSGESGNVDVYVKGEGKTAGFDGIASINCENSTGMYWKTASNFGEPFNESAINGLLPKDVLQNARRIFCKRN